MEQILALFIGLSPILAFYAFILRGYIVKKNDARKLESTQSTPLDPIQKKKLDHQLELMDPWYPDHDEWLDWNTILDIEEIKKDDPLLYIQTKLELWMDFQKFTNRMLARYPDMKVYPEALHLVSRMYEEPVSNTSMRENIKGMRWGVAHSFDIDRLLQEAEECAKRDKLRARPYTKGEEKAIVDLTHMKLNQEQQAYLREILTQYHKYDR